MRIAQGNENRKATVSHASQHCSECEWLQLEKDILTHEILRYCPIIKAAETYLAKIRAATQQGAMKDAQTQVQEFQFSIQLD